LSPLKSMQLIRRAERDIQNKEVSGAGGLNLTSFSGTSAT
jgi:hypothetical protein